MIPIRYKLSRIAIDYRLPFSLDPQTNLYIPTSQDEKTNPKISIDGHFTNEEQIAGLMDIYLDFQLKEDNKRLKEEQITPFTRKLISHLKFEFLESIIIQNMQRVTLRKDLKKIADLPDTLSRLAIYSRSIPNMTE